MFVVDYHEKSKKTKCFLYEGELACRSDGLHCINGYGRYLFHGLMAIGQFKNHNLHGYAKVMRSDGCIREGFYKNNRMEGSGRIIH